RHAARTGASEPRRTIARAPRHTADARRAANSGAAGARSARTDLADARSARARAAVDRRRMGERRTDAVYSNCAGANSRRRLRGGGRGYATGLDGRIGT